MRCFNNIRPATADEQSALIAIWEEAVAGTHDFVSKADLAEIRGRMPEYLKGVEVWVCEEDGELKGFVGLAGDRIEMLFVRERGAGIGTRLLDFAVGQGAHKVDVNEQNRPAVAFYEKRGFEVCGRSETDNDGRAYPLLSMILKK